MEDYGAVWEYDFVGEKACADMAEAMNWYEDAKSNNFDAINGRGVAYNNMFGGDNSSDSNISIFVSDDGSVEEESMVIFNKKTGIVSYLYRDSAESLGWRASFEEPLGRSSERTAWPVKVTEDNGNFKFGKAESAYAPISNNVRVPHMSDAVRTQSRATDHLSEESKQILQGEINRYFRRVNDNDFCM